MQLKAYTKGKHVLRFEAIVHNAKVLRCRRSLDNFDQIIGRLAEMADRFAAALDRADAGFLPDGVLDELPLPAQAGARRIAGIDLNKPRIRAALAAALALAPAPGGLTVAEHAAQWRCHTVNRKLVILDTTESASGRGRGAGQGSCPLARRASIRYLAGSMSGLR